MKKSQILEAKNDILDFQEDTDEFLQELYSLYDQAAYRIEADLNTFFQRYCDENGLSKLEAQKLLNAKEFKTWKMDMDQYIAEISAAGDDTKLVYELNALSAKSRISRQEELLANIYKEMAEIADKIDKKMDDHLHDVLIENFSRGIFKIQQTAEIGFNVSKLNSTLIKKVLAYPWSTKTFSKEIWERTDLLCETLRREIVAGLQDGSSIQKMVQRVNGCMNRGRKNAERIVRTECKFFANQGQLMGYQKMGVKKYRFMGGGCAKCRAVAGEVFDLEKAEVNVNYPPMHPNCKCTTTAIFEISMFDNRRNVEPLEKNTKFTEWKKKYLKG